MPLSETVLILAGLLSVAIVSAGVFRSVPIPYTVLLVIIGMLLGEGAHVLPALEPLEKFRLSPDLVFFIFLPALIFESGFNLPARQLVKDLAPILVLAVPALVISTVVVGVGLSFLDMDLTTALLFGALISATDPVAVIALFKELGAPERLTVLVEGESLLNDATAIVVFGILLAIAVGGESLSWSSADTVVLEFLRVFVGGTVVGGLLGFAVSELLYRLRSGVSAVLTMSLVVAYGSFILAEHTLHVSGVMAGAGSAVALSGFGMTRLRHEATDAAAEFWEVIALVCNSMLFLLVGLSVDLGALASAIVPATATVVLVLAARGVAIYTLVPVTTGLLSLPRVSMSERHIMWWGGLKGGLAIAIALSIPENLPGRDLLLNITLAVVLFTLLVNAPTIRPLMTRLQLARLTEEEEVELRHALLSAHGEAAGVLNRLRGAEIISETTRQEVSERIKDSFVPPAPAESESPSAKDRVLVELLAARCELGELTSLYEQGVIPQHVYLDMRNELHGERNADARTRQGILVEGRSLILRFETALMGMLREKNWAAALLSIYQNTRLAEHLRRDIARMLICSSVIEMLAGRDDLDERARWSVSAAYERGLAHHGAAIREVQTGFPDFYRRFGARLSTQVCLTAAMRHARQVLHDGDLGGKTFNVMERRIAEALSSIAPLSKPVPAVTPAELRKTVPLLHRLPEFYLRKLAWLSRTATYLSGDTIISHGDRGDAFYIITHGDVDVYRDTLEGEEMRIGTLGPGDFIGETSLLYYQARAHSRTATIRARTPVTLLRLPRKEMINLMTRHPEIQREMAAINRERDRSARLIQRAQL